MRKGGKYGPVLKRYNDRREAQEHIGKRPATSKTAYKILGLWSSGCRFSIENLGHKGSLTKGGYVRI
ncbi:hypothetical protein PIB30_092639 [Stylosanthes scabra]|uniref:Uncharacterized protein n=1 Tax=Stylosanthes scabra TaxID=79078 RepID=A0ABU6ZTL4_9FABA|nr:hypothetical protein [Stylosanthes scabra]